MNAVAGAGRGAISVKKRRAEAEGRKLRFEARHDILTGLYNKPELFMSKYSQPKP